MIIELTPTADEKHLLVGLINDKVVNPKKTLEKMLSKKAVEEVEENAKTEPSSYFYDVFDVDFPSHCLRKE